MAQNLLMPSASAAMSEGKLARWRVKEGDSFAAGILRLRSIGLGNRGDYSLWISLPFFLAKPSFQTTTNLTSG